MESLKQRVFSCFEKYSYDLDIKVGDKELFCKKVSDECNIMNPATNTLLNICSETAISLATSTDSPDFGVLASRASLALVYLTAATTFTEACDLLMKNVNDACKSPSPLICKETYAFIVKNKGVLEATIDYKRDHKYSFFALQTLQNSYLLKIKGQVIERPQHMLMRVACGIHYPNLEKTLETYRLLSMQAFTHASPTLFNAGTPSPQLSSCFLLTLAEDSIEGIFGQLTKCAQISKNAGGIGLSVSGIRAKDSYIKGTNGTSNGLVPMLRVFNSVARWIDQGGGKRKGAYCIYLEPWHADVEDFLELRQNTGAEELRARDLFYALWLPDLFMQKVKEDDDWYLMCPKECPGLNLTWGKEFEALYTKYCKEKKYRKKVKARILWQAALESQLETGNPFFLFKDSCNKKSNQKNLGTIQCSNLCTEIVQYTSKKEIAVCNLASLSLPFFVRPNQSFDFQKLYDVTRVVTYNLNTIIDRNRYPVSEAQNSNLKHRPIGIGVQGLADVFHVMKIPFDSSTARKLNKEIFETIYFAALSESTKIAETDGEYSSYKGSPASKGVLQFDLWDTEPTSNLWNWRVLKDSIQKHGLRNSLLVAPMPTASTSQILGNNECIEPYTSNLYIRRTLAGEFVCVNKHLVKELQTLGFWDKKTREALIRGKGSIQNISHLSEDMKKRFRTVWEIPQSMILKMAAERGPYIDQSQSLNIHMEGANHKKLTACFFMAWSLGLKSTYYLRTKPACDAIQVTMAPSPISKKRKISAPDVTEGGICRREEGCISCSG